MDESSIVYELSKLNFLLKPNTSMIDGVYEIMYS